MSEKKSELCNERPNVINKKALMTVTSLRLFS